MVRSYVCFVSHSDDESAHTNPKEEPFASEANVWIGYFDEPVRRYRDHPSLQEITETCQKNLASGAKGKFPRYIKNLPTRCWEGESPLNEPYVRQAFCAACRGGKRATNNPATIKIDYMPVYVRTVAGNSRIWLAAYVFSLHGESMVSLVYHTHHGLFAFQKTNGSVTTTMFADTKRDDSMVSPSSDDYLTTTSGETDTTESDGSHGAQSDSSVAPDSSSNHSTVDNYPSMQTPNPTVAFNPSPTPNPVPASNPSPTPNPPQMQNHNVRRPGHTVIIDLTKDDTDIEAENEADSETEKVPNTAAHRSQITFASCDYTIRQAESSRGGHTSVQQGEASSDSNSNVIKTEYGAFVASLVNDHGIEKCSHPEAKRLKLQMGEAAKKGDRHSMCQIYGTLDAFLEL